MTCQICRWRDQGAALAKEVQHDFRKWRGKPSWRFRKCRASGVVNGSSRQYEACFALTWRPEMAGRSPGLLVKEQSAHKLVFDGHERHASRPERMRSNDALHQRDEPLLIGLAQARQRIPVGGARRLLHLLEQGGSRGGQPASARAA